MAEAEAGDGRPVAMKKSAWSTVEDAVLKQQVAVHGAQNWAAISEALPGRNPKSCRLRWCQHLSPVVDTATAFTAQEDDKIIANYHKYPNKWATIAGFLPGRTDNAVKNRWHSVLGKLYLQQQQQQQWAVHGLQQQQWAVHGPIRPTLFLFPLAPGDVKAFGRERMIPVLRRLPPPGVDLSGECLKLFPLEAGDLVRGDNAREAAAMDMDHSTDESLVELRLWPSTNHKAMVQTLNSDP